MAAKTYVLSFGTGDSRNYSGLLPTFLLFFDNTGTNQAKPTITELVAGSGAYGFSYTISATQSIYFLANTATTLPTANDNYIRGVIDPVLAVDQSTNSLAAAIGATTDSIGSTSVDPGTMYGFLKRLTEFNEGDSIFTASTGVWQIYNRTGLGTTTLLRTKTLVNNSTSVTKTGL